MWKFYLVAKKGFLNTLIDAQIRTESKDLCNPSETNSIIQPLLPSGISWVFDAPSPSEFPILSAVGVWIFSGTTQ